MVTRPRALVFGRTEGAPYHPLAAVRSALDALLTPAFEATFTEDWAELKAVARTNPALLVGVDDRFGAPVDQEALAAVEAWVRAGGVLALVHNGICWAGSARWRRLAGGRFTGHGEAKVLRFRRADGAEFRLHEEPYRFSAPLFNPIRIEATYEDGGREWPALWWRKLGRGRILYALPGHWAPSYQDPDYALWLRSFLVDHVPAARN